MADVKKLKINGINYDIKIPSENVKLMTGYSKGSSTNAITPSDSLNSAVGKLECRADANQANDLYAINTGVKNKLNVLVDTVKALPIINTGTWNGNIYTIENVGTATFNSDGSITIVKTGTSSRFLIWLAYNIVPSTIAGKWINGCPSGGSQSTYGMNVEQIASPYGSKAIDYGNGALINDSTIELGIYIVVEQEYVTSSDGITFYPMICEKSIADVDPSYQPYAFTNSTITTGILDALNERKNKFNPDNITELRNLSKNGSDYAYVATATDTRTQCNYSLFSYNNSTKIDMLANILVTSRRGVIITFTKTSDFNKIAFGHSGQTKDFMVFYDVSGLVNGQSYVLRCIVTQYNPSLENFAFSDVMICTEADYNVSQKFVPFAKSNKELTDLTSGLLATAYQPVTPVGNYLSGIEGGYVRVGNLVLINIRCTVSNATPASWTVVLSGLPYTLIQYGQGVSGAPLSNNKGADMAITGAGTIASTTSIATGTLLISGVYICK